MSTVYKVKAWIDKHAAVIDPQTQSLLRKELKVEVKKSKRKVRA
jgi:hypothetical protein